MAQELSCESSLSMRSLTPNKLFGAICSIRQRAGMRVEATAILMSPGLSQSELGKGLGVTFQQIQK